MGGYLGTANAKNVGLHNNEEPTFDPQVGFNYTRKPRTMIATEEEMISNKIPLKNRDYCAHLAIDYKRCRFEHWPLVYRCAHEKHNFLNCEQQDYVIRMKEFERERRLRLREQRLNGGN